MAVEFYETSMLQNSFQKWRKILSISRNIYRKVKQAVSRQRQKRLAETWKHWTIFIEQQKYLQNKYTQAEKSYKYSLLSRFYLGWYTIAKRQKIYFLINVQ